MHLGFQGTPLSPEPNILAHSRMKYCCVTHKIYFCKIYSTQIFLQNNILLSYNMKICAFSFILI